MCIRDRPWDARRAAPAAADDAAAEGAAAAGAPCHGACVALVRALSLTLAPRGPRRAALDGDDAPRAADFDLRAALPQPLDARATASSVRAAAALVGAQARARGAAARASYGAARRARRVLRVFHRQFLDAGRPSRSLLRARHAFLRVATEKRAALTVQCGQRRRLAMRVAEDRRWEHDAAKAAAKVGARVRGMHVRERRRPKKREAW